MEDKKSNSPKTETKDVLPPARAGGKAKNQSRWQRVKQWYSTHKKVAIPITILSILLILFIIPFTRYAIAGLFIKKNFTILVIDSTAHSPVSGATVTAGAVSATTNGSGRATLHALKVGEHQFVISKKHYESHTFTSIVPILKQKSVPVVNLVATGRQVELHVTNLITGKDLAGVNVELDNSTAKTDLSGKVLLVVPTGITAQKVKLSLLGYNSSEVTIQIDPAKVKINEIKLTPSGRVYFLRQGSGNFDLMKTNLDGSDSQVAVAATGTEDPAMTKVLESADGKYVALISHRNVSDPTPQLYVLATADDNLLQIDNGNDDFQMFDWAGDTLIYSLHRLDLPAWQQGTSKLKAYDATSGSTTLLDQSAGSDSALNTNEYYAFITVTANDVIYGKTWQGGNFLSSTKQNSLQSITISGQNHQTVASYPVADALNFILHDPDTVYVHQQATDTDADSYFSYSAGGTVKPISIDSSQFVAPAEKFYFSPSRQLTFWSQDSNGSGQSNLITADQAGNGKSIIKANSQYQAYGWFTEQYLLLSNNGSGIYIMPVKAGTPIKITD